MIKPWLQDSLFLRMGLMLGAIILLALISMAASIIIAAATHGDAAAINTSGSLRMQSYRIATSFLPDPAATKMDIQATKLEEEIREFEQRLTSQSLNDAIPNAPYDNRRLALEQVESLWRVSVKPALQEATRSIILDQPATATHTSSNHEILAQINTLVRQIDLLVKQLEYSTESKVLWLRMIPVIALALTVILALFILRRTRLDVVLPLQDLTAAADRMRRGDFNARARSTGANELGALGQAFNNMAEDLSCIHTELESRVAEQTHALRASHDSLELLYRTSRRLNEAPPDAATLRSLLQEIGGFAQADSVSINLKPGASPFSEGAQTLSIQLRNEATQAPSKTVSTPIPIRDQNEQFGELRVCNASSEAIAAGRMETLAAVARHIAISLCASRQSERDRSLALLEERSAIARELHDSLAQNLSYLKLQTGCLQTLLNRNAARTEIDKITNDLRDGLNAAWRQLRELLSTFRLKMDHPSLERALRKTIQDFIRHSKLEIHLEYGLADCPLTPSEEIHILQIVREALNNAVRHAHARHIRVTLNQDADNEISISVADDGVGLPQQAERPHHYGLSIMRERARNLDGRLRVRSKPATGTQVELCLIPSARRSESGSLEPIQHAD